MSKRLQVLLDESEMAAVRRAAEQRHTTVAEWVRQALRKARQEQPAVEAGKKTQVVREAVRHEYPTGDIGEMLREIARGRSDELEP